MNRIGLLQHLFTWNQDNVVVVRITIVVPCSPPTNIRPINVIAAPILIDQDNATVRTSVVKGSVPRTGMATSRFRSILGAIVVVECRYKSSDRCVFVRCGTFNPRRRGVITHGFLALNENLDKCAYYAAF